MTRVLSIRDALVEARRFINEDKARAVRIQELMDELEAALDQRANAVDGVVETLHEAIGGIGALIGVEIDTGDDDDREPVAAVRPTKKQKASPAVAEVSEVAGPVIDENIELSELELAVVEQFKIRWPKFTTGSQLARCGAIESPDHASPTITRLRRKNIPIESAKQARENDPTIRPDVSGWRLIVS